MQHAQSQQLEQSRAAREQQRPADFEHWLEIGKRVDNPAIAELIVEFMDLHPTVKVRLGGLYVLAQDSLNRHLGGLYVRAADSLNLRRLELASEVEELASEVEELASKVEVLASEVSRRQVFRPSVASIRRIGVLAYRSVRLVCRGVRDLLLLIQKAVTVSHVQPAMAKGNLHGRRA